jgi:hypothetical protein
MRINYCLGNLFRTIKEWADYELWVDDCAVFVTANVWYSEPPSKRGHPDQWTEGDEGEVEILAIDTTNKEVNDWLNSQDRVGRFYAEEVGKALIALLEREGRV